MKRFFFISILAACGCLFTLAARCAEPHAIVKHVAILGVGSRVEIEISGSQALMPKAQAIANPARLVVDFPGTVPGPGLHNVAVNRGDVKGVRVGLFSSSPPVTRVVLDLNSPSPYQLFPSGRSVIVKLDGAGARTVNASAGKPVLQISDVHTGSEISPAPSRAASAPSSALSSQGYEVDFQNGLLTIRARKATLGQVLAEIQRKTGAEVTIPPQAQQEPIVADIGPAPPNVALASLLDGSHFDFILVGSEKDPNSLRTILLTPQGNAIPDSQINPVVVNPPPEDASPVENAEPQPDTNTAPDAETPPPPPPDPPEPQPEPMQ